MNAKTEIFKTPEGGMEVRMTFDRAYLELLGRDLPNLIREAATHKLAEKLVAEKGQEIIAKIPLESVLNQVVAEAVRKIGAVAEEPKK